MARTSLAWESGTLRFNLESRACPADAVEALEARLRDELKRARWDRSACETVGKELWQWLHGTEHWLGLRGVRPGQPWQLEIGGELPALQHLPWELLHDANGFLAEQNSDFVPLRRIDDGRATLSPAMAPAFGLAVLFMAASPESESPLHFEEEEGRILREVPLGSDIHLEVEESGTTQGFATKLGALEDWSVGHLSCHGTSEPAPHLAMEDDEGNRVLADADAVLDALRPGMPRLLVVSACASAEYCDDPGVRRSLAMQLVEGGCPQVLGFGTKVRDDEAIALAGDLYRALDKGMALDVALAHVRRDLAKRHEGDVRTWGALRLFSQVAPGLLAARRTVRTPRAAVRPVDGVAVLSGPDRSMPIANPMRFVGRRRVLQHTLRALHRAAGVVLVGLGGVGKSSVAGRILSRRPDLEPVVLVGRLDRTSLVRALRGAYLASREVAAALHDEVLLGTHDRPEGLVTMLAQALATPAVKARPALIVLDDAEVNLVDAAGAGDKVLTGEAASCLRALLQVLAQPGMRTRVLVTSRCSLPLPPQVGVRLATLEEVPMGAPSPRDQTKMLQRATRYDDDGRVRQGVGALWGDATQQGRLLTLTGDNPRLFALVHRVGWHDAVAGLALLEQIDAYMAGGKRPDDPEVLRDLMVMALESLLDLLGARSRALLGRLAVVSVPLPRRAVEAALGVEAAVLDRWVRLGAVERDLEGDIMVPRLLRPLVDAVVDAEDRKQMEAALWGALAPTWKVGERGAWVGTLPQAHFVARVCAETEAAVGDRERSALRAVVPWLVGQSRTGEVRALSALVERSGEAAKLALVMSAAWAPADAAESTRFLSMAKGQVAPAEVSHRAAAVWVADGERLWREGDGDAALTAYRTAHQMLADDASLEPDVREHQRAVVMGRIADILHARGDLHGALRSLETEVLPAFDRLGDVQSKAVTMGRIADILHARGDLDGALRIRREEELPVYERLGDVRSQAVVMVKLTDILQARGDLDGAQRSLETEVLPAFDRLGDVRSKAVTMGKIADILQVRGDLDGALRILREEQLPVYERLGDVRSRLVCQANMAILHLQMPRSAERQAEIVRLLRAAYTDACRMKLPEAAQIEAIAARIKMTREMLLAPSSGPPPPPAPVADGDELLLVIPQRSAGVAAHGMAPAESPLTRIVQRLRTQHRSAIVQSDAPPEAEGAVAAVAAVAAAPTPAAQTTVLTGLGALLVRGDAAVAAALRADADVALVASANSVIAEVPPLAGDAVGAVVDAWHLDAVAAPQAHAAGHTGDGCCVGIVDTGIDAGHPEFAGKEVLYAAFDSAGVEEVGASAADAHGHGSHVAGIVAGVTAGVAPRASLAVANALPDGRGNLAQIAAGIDWLLRLRHADGTPRVDVLNLSLQVYTPSAGAGPRRQLSTALKAVIELAQDVGVVVVAAIGNTGPRHLASPGNFPDVLGVGAHDRTGARWSKTCVGSVLPGGPVKPEVWAPGVDVVSARSGGGYVAMTGTSMATPVVAGLALLLRNALGPEADVLNELRNRADGGGRVTFLKPVVS